MHAGLGQFRVEESGVHRKGFLVNWFHMSRNGDIPIDDSLALISESFDFLLMSVSNELLAVISDGRVGSWNVVGVEGTHNKLI